jgi:hypothetical protein
MIHVKSQNQPCFVKSLFRLQLQIALLHTGQRSYSMEAQGPNKPLAEAEYLGKRLE